MPIQSHDTGITNPNKVKIVSLASPLITGAAATLSNQVGVIYPVKGVLVGLTFFSTSTSTAATPTIQFTVRDLTTATTLFASAAIALITGTCSHTAMAMPSGITTVPARDSEISGLANQIAAGDYITVDITTSVSGVLTAPMVHLYFQGLD